MISAAIVIGTENSSFVVQPYQAYLIFVGISAFGVFMNIFGYRILGAWNEGACKPGNLPY